MSVSRDQLGCGHKSLWFLLLGLSTDEMTKRPLRGVCLPGHVAEKAYSTPVLLSQGTNQLSGVWADNTQGPGELSPAHRLPEKYEPGSVKPRVPQFV